MTAAILAPALDRKRENTVIAQFALRGHAVHRPGEGGYLVTWNGYSRHCTDLESLERFARVVGVE